MVNFTILAGGILLYATIFILGFIIGRLTKNATIELPMELEPKLKNHFPAQEAKRRKVVRIDEKKFVTSVSIDSLQKKGKELGVNDIVEDDVDTAVSKLTLLKKK